MQKVHVYVNALAKLVTGHAASGRTRDFETKHDKTFKHGGLVEKTWSGDYRLMSLDETQCFNVPAAYAGKVFRIS